MGETFCFPIMPFDDNFSKVLSDLSCLLILGSSFTVDVHTFVTGSQVGARMYAPIYVVCDYNFGFQQGVDFNWRRIVLSSRFFFVPLRISSISRAQLVSGACKDLTSTLWFNLYTLECWMLRVLSLCCLYTRTKHRLKKCKPMLLCWEIENDGCEYRHW